VFVLIATRCAASSDADVQSAAAATGRSVGSQPSTEYKRTTNTDPTVVLRSTVVTACFLVSQLFLLIIFYLPANGRKPIKHKILSINKTKKNLA